MRRVCKLECRLRSKYFIKLPNQAGAACRKKKCEDCVRVARSMQTPTWESTETIVHDAGDAEPIPRSATAPGAGALRLPQTCARASYHQPGISKLTTATGQPRKQVASGPATQDMSANNTCQYDSGTSSRLLMSEPRIASNCATSATIAEVLAYDSVSALRQPWVCEYICILECAW